MLMNIRLKSPLRPQIKTFKIKELSAVTFSRTLQYLPFLSSRHMPVSFLLSSKDPSFTSKKPFSCAQAAQLAHQDCRG